MTSIGELIIDEIIKQGMVRYEDGLFIWNGNAIEQLEALVEQYIENKTK